MSSNIRVQKICQYCEQSFVARTTVTQYCSDSCSKKAYKERNRQKKIQESFEETVKKRTELFKQISQKEFLNVSEACTIFGISRTTLWRLTRKGKLRKADIGKRAIYLKKDLYNLFK